MKITAEAKTRTYSALRDAFTTSGMDAAQAQAVADQLVAMAAEQGLDGLLATTKVGAADLQRSPKTPGYSVTHHPLGTEGLWHHEGLELPAYIQNVAKGMMESGMSREHAIPAAINAVERWARGEGHVHPEVVAASQKAVAEWEKLKAEH